MIYSSIIHPYLTYGIEAWHGTFKNHTNKIFILQKKAIRAINNLDFNSHTNEYFILNQILKLEDQYRFQISAYIFKLLNSNTDKEVLIELQKNIRDHPHDTRNGEVLSVSRIIRSKSKNMISHNGVKFWNSIPSNIRNSNSFYKFKNNVKTFFLDQY